MTGSMIGNAFASVASIPQRLQDWWSEKTFWLYYYTMACDPDELLGALHLKDNRTHRLAHFMEKSRGSLLASTAARYAAGDHDSRPISGAFVQKLLNPALDIAMRTNIKSPLVLATLALTTVLAVDYLYGGHMRDTTAHVMASLNSESGRMNDPVVPGPDKAPPLDYSI